MQEADSSENSTHFYRLHQFVSQNTETEITYLQAMLASPLSQKHFIEHADINFRSQILANFPAKLMRRFDDNIRKSVFKIETYLLHRHIFPHQTGRFKENCILSKYLLLSN